MRRRNEQLEIDVFRKGGINNHADYSNGKRPGIRIGD